MVYFQFMIVLFLILLFLTKKLYKQFGVTPSLLIVATFLFSTIVGLFYNLVIDKHERYDYSYFSMIYYAATLFIFLIPLIKHNGVSSSFHFPPRIIRYISNLLIVFGILSLYSSAKNFSFADLAGNWSDVRAEYYLSWGDTKIGATLLERIQSNVTHILFLCLPLAFYNLSKKNMIYTYLLIIASITTLLESLQNAERQNLILWFANLLMSYLMFRNMLDEKIRHRFNIFMIASVVIIISFVVAISISRFGEGDELVVSLFNYSGAQPYNAAYFLENLSDQALWGKLNFPYVIGDGMIFSINDHIKANVFLNSFSSIVGSFYKDFGYYTIIFVSLFVLLFDKLLSLSKKKESFLYLYIYCFYFSLMFVGVFYNKYTSPVMARIVVFVGILIVLLEVLTKKKIKK